MQFIVLCSSNGTVFQATLDRIADESLQAECLALITDTADRGCVDKAHGAGIPVVVVEKKQGETREEYDKKLHAEIQSVFGGSNTKDSLIACMGWMRIFSGWFIQHCSYTILNVHPSLLPKHGGKGMYGPHVHQAVLESGDAESGVSIHIVEEEVDAGRVLLQQSCPVHEHDTIEMLQKRVQELEKKCYPELLQSLHTNGLESI